MKPFPTVNKTNGFTIKHIFGKNSKVYFGALYFDFLLHFSFFMVDESKRIGKYITSV